MEINTLNLTFTHTEDGALTSMDWSTDNQEVTLKYLLDGALAFVLQGYSKIVPKENIHDACQQLADTFEAALYSMALDDEEDLND